MNALERKAAVFLAESVTRGDWSEAALADVLASLGLITRKEAEKVAEKFGQDPDPNYESLCPSGDHPADGNVYRTKDSRVRCAACAAEEKRRRAARCTSASTA